VLAGVDGSSPVPLTAGILAAVGVVMIARHLRDRQGGLAHAAGRGLGYANRLLRRDPESGQARIRALANELMQIRPRNRDWLAGLSYAALNWVADLACLVASCRAVGAHGTTIELAVVAYTAGMTVSSISLLPGGLGVVDAAMILALTHGGLSPVSATAGVLLYRLISFVFVVALGWALWVGTRHSGARRGLELAASDAPHPADASTGMTGARLFMG
jgi:uncharacterized membrane protein YbhN (UPF0104 family)